MSTTITAHGRSMTIQQWADRTGLAVNTIRKRLLLGASPEAAVEPIAFGEKGGRGFRTTRGNIPDGHPGASSWSRDEWSDDDHAWYVVAHHPDGITLDQASQVMGLAKERVRQVEQIALRKVAYAMAIERRLGPSAAAPVLERLRGRSLKAYMRERTRIEARYGGRP